MPPDGIHAGSSEECFRAFADRMDRLLRRTLLMENWIRFNAHAIRGQPSAILTLRRGGADKPATTIPIRADPPLYFAARQELRTVPAEHGGGVRLRTIGYRYALTTDATPTSSAAVRWEFGEGRHHLQVPTTVSGLDLNDLHVPTGWVPLERVLAFLRSELGVPGPTDTDAALDELLESERQFFEDFADVEDLLGVLGTARAR